jgi:hypothetical protein
MNSQVELKEFLPEAKTGIYKPKKHITLNSKTILIC